MRDSAVVASALHSLAFLLLLLVSLSVPIIKDIYIFKLTANVGSSLLKSGASGSARFGVWGYCISAIDVSIAGIDHDTSAQCSRTHLGYSFDSTVVNALHVNGIENAISRTLTAVLVLHPIACGLAFLTLIASLLATRSRDGRLSRITPATTLALNALAFLFSLVVLLIDAIGVSVVEKRVSGDGVHMTQGNGVWLTLGATIALLIPMAFEVLWLRRQTRNADKY